MSILRDHKRKYNSRFLLYCKYYNKSPEEMTEIDKKRWDGNFSMGFSVWWHHMVLKWREYKRYDRNITTVQEPLIEKWVEGYINTYIKKKKKALKNGQKPYKW